MMISERLRDIANDDDLGPGTTEVRAVLHEAADVIDALVAVAERLSAGEWSDEGHTALREAADAALAAARK